MKQFTVVYDAIEADGSTTMGIAEQFENQDEAQELIDELRNTDYAEHIQMIFTEC